MWPFLGIGSAATALVRRVTALARRVIALARRVTAHVIGTTAHRGPGAAIAPRTAGVPIGITRESGGHLAAAADRPLATAAGDEQRLKGP